MESAADGETLKQLCLLKPTTDSLLSSSSSLRSLG